jgi:hypothetical protein
LVLFVVCAKTCVCLQPKHNDFANHSKTIMQSKQNTNTMPQVRHPKYLSLEIQDPDTLTAFIQSSMTVQQYQLLPEHLGMTSSWLGRKLSNPNQFSVAELRKLSALLNTKASDLALTYGVGLDEMSSGDILNILCEEGYMLPNTTAAAAAPSEALAEEVSSTANSSKP